MDTLHLPMEDLTKRIAEKLKIFIDNYKNAIKFDYMPDLIPKYNFIIDSNKLNDKKLYLVINDTSRPVLLEELASRIIRQLNEPFENKIITMIHVEKISNTANDKNEITNGFFIDLFIKYYDLSLSELLKNE